VVRLLGSRHKRDANLANSKDPGVDFASYHIGVAQENEFGCFRKMHRNGMD
jgi:hypothetical protein